MLLVFGFTASAFAIHADIPSETQAVVAKGQTQITLDGEIRVRGEYKHNTATFNEDHTSNYDQRVRLGVEAKVTPNTMGYVQLESGNADNTDLFTWGTAPDGTTGAKGTYTVGNSKRGDLRILQAWILHTGSGLLGMPAGVKVGHMPLKLGNGLFFDHTKFGDDAIVVFADPTKELHTALLTAKFREGATNKSDDADAYVGLAVYSPNKNTSVSFDVTYVDDQKTFMAPNNTHLWNFGLRGNTEISGFALRADAELQTGKVDTNPDVKFRGYAYLVGVGYKLAPVNLTLDYANGSGDDGSDPRKFKTFVTSLGADQHFTYVYEYRTVNAAGNTNGGLQNTWYLKLGGSADLMKDLSLDAALYYLRANKSVALMGSPNKSKKLGTELDAKVTYKIDRNLSYWVEGGYLFAGSAFDPSATKGADDAYAVRHGIQLNF